MESTEDPCNLLGSPSETMTQSEADLRVFLHEVHYFSHDKDYRTSAALVLDTLKRYCLCFVRLDGSYQASVDTIPGTHFTGSPERCIWLHAAKGHLTLLVPDKPCLPLLSQEKSQLLGGKNTSRQALPKRLRYLPRNVPFVMRPFLPLQHARAINSAPLVQVLFHYASD